VVEDFTSKRQILGILENRGVPVLGSENDEASLLYRLAFEVNGAVLMAADGWSVLASWLACLESP